MSPRAACRLETLGFGEAYDYVAGKADWLAHGFPREGEKAAEPRALDIAAHDVVTCPLDARIDDVRAPLAASRCGFAFVLSSTGVLLGRLRGSVLKDGGDAAAEAVMEPGASTIRADAALAPLAERMRSRELTTLPITTPDGRFLGVVRRDDLEVALQRPPSTPP
jgi:CBS-domain-containing membrane protein